MTDMDLVDGATVAFTRTVLAGRDMELQKMREALSKKDRHMMDWTHTDLLRHSISEANVQEKFKAGKYTITLTPIAEELDFEPIDERFKEFELTIDRYKETSRYMLHIRVTLQCKKQQIDAVYYDYRYSYIKSDTTIKKEVTKAVCGIGEEISQLVKAFSEGHYASSGKDDQWRDCYVAIFKFVYDTCEFHGNHFSPDRLFQEPKFARSLMYQPVIKVEHLDFVKFAMQQGDRYVNILDDEDVVSFIIQPWSGHFDAYTYARSGDVYVKDTTHPFHKRALLSIELMK